MQATPIDELRQPHPDQKRIDAEAARLLLATAPAGYAKKRSKSVGAQALLPDAPAHEPFFPRH